MRMFRSWWWFWRRRSIHAEHEKRRLTAEAESDRLRLRVSSLLAADTRADHLQLELEKARTGTVRMPEVEGELKTLRLQAAMVPELENQIANLRARADEADRLEEQLAKLDRPEPVTDESTIDEPVSEEPVIDLREAPPEPGHKDDLQVIKGIGPVMETTLNRYGIKTWEQLAALTDDDAVNVGVSIGTFRGRIGRDRWVEQAVELIAQYPLAEPYDRPSKNNHSQQK